jgi:ribosomal-protein-alanine N-acetyltransferase
LAAGRPLSIRLRIGQGKGMYSFQPLERESALEIIRWQYEPPYDLYNHRPEEEETDLRRLSDRKNGFFSIRAGNGELIGFCSFGADARVPGGDYREDMLDIGLGIRPDLTGRGAGAEVIGGVLRFAAEQFHPARFRVTIALFNGRALRAWKKAGFAEIKEFVRKRDGRKFVMLVKNS